MPVVSTSLRWCPQCRSEQEFERPPCADGHGLDCPDLACVACGAALVLAGGDGLRQPAALVQPTAA